MQKYCALACNEIPLNQYLLYPKRGRKNHKNSPIHTMSPGGIISEKQGDSERDICFVRVYQVPHPNCIIGQE